MILYFSGTGNSRYVAQRLAAILGDSIMEINRSNMPACDIMPDNGRVIWVFPTHSWGVPAIVREFMEKATVSGGGHYMVCTCGDEIGMTAHIWRRLAARKGWDTAGAFDVIMPNTYTLLPGFDVDSKDLEEKKLAAVDRRVDDIAARIKSRFTGEDISPGPMPRIKSYILYPLFRRFMHSAKPFGYDSSRCTRCGKCASVCPTGNITLDKEGHPHWDDRCTMCLACYHHCPVHAVRYGNRTNGKGQYLCPLHMP